MIAKNYLIENEKNKQRLNLVKEENECGKNAFQEINDMQISQDKENEEKRDVQSVNEYKDEILNNLIEEEKKIKYEINPNYFQYQTEINQDMRSILIDWLIDVHNKTNTNNNTAHKSLMRTHNINNSDLRNKYRKELKENDDEIILGHVGRFNEQKNQLFFHFVN